MRKAACGYQQPWGGCSWHWAQEFESFHKWSTLCSVKENEHYVILGPSGFVREMNMQKSFAKEVQELLHQRVLCCS